MARQVRIEDNDDRDDDDFGWLPLLCVAIGTGLIAASLTPDIAGPGWLAFGGVYLVAYAIRWIARRFR